MGGAMTGWMASLDGAASSRTAGDLLSRAKERERVLKFDALGPPMKPAPLRHVGPARTARASTAALGCNECCRAANKRN